MWLLRFKRNPGLTLNNRFFWLTIQINRGRLSLIGSGSLTSSLLHAGRVTRGQVIRDKTQGEIFLGEDSERISCEFHTVIYVSKEGDRIVMADLLWAFISILQEEGCFDPFFHLSSGKLGHSARRLLAYLVKGRQRPLGFHL